MTTQALYNRWRGQTFDDILGQEPITRTLQNQIRAGRIGHAYLFTGLRGTGKTSTARILAKAVNCTGKSDHPPCNACPSCLHITAGRSLDLIEIDAASNRGIDEIRELRERVAFVPQESRYKVYVIDEVHMLTNEAFNALLKTLEEPPPHVIFILCTTEPHRLPDTILSRCQRFDFRRGSLADVEAKLRRICEAEGLAISPQALQLIARRAGGSFRDGESLLEQLAAFGSGEITTELVEALLGTAPLALLGEVLRSLTSGETALGLRAINQALDEGVDPRQFAQEIVEHLRVLLLWRVGAADYAQQLSGEALSLLSDLARQEGLALRTLVRAIRLFSEAIPGLRNAARPQLPLELALIEALMQEEREQAERGETSQRVSQPIALARGRDATRTSVIAEAEMASSKAIALPLADEASQSAEGPLVTPDALPTPELPDMAEGEQTSYVQTADERNALVAPNLTLDWVRGHWNAVLTRMKSQDRQLQALLRDVYPVAVQGDVVTLACKWPLHRDRISQADKRTLVEQLLSDAVGVLCRIQCIVQADVGSRQADASPEQPAEGPRRGAAKDLLSSASPVKGQADAKHNLLNHPVIKDLERRGGRVENVEIYDPDDSGG